VTREDQRVRSAREESNRKCHATKMRATVTRGNPRSVNQNRDANTRGISMRASLNKSRNRRRLIHVNYGDGVNEAASLTSRQKSRRTDRRQCDRSSKATET